DVPGGRVAFVVADDGAAHREDDALAVEGHVDVLDVVQAVSGDRAGDVDLGGGGRGAAAHEQVGIRHGAALVAQVVAFHGNRALDVGDREIDGARVGRLAAADIDAAAAAAAAQERADGSGGHDAPQWMECFHVDLPTPEWSGHRWIKLSS